MNDLRKKINLYFEKIALGIYQRPWLVFVSVAAVVLGLALQVPKLKTDMSVEGYFHEDDPIIMDYEKLRDQFGRDAILIVAINPPDVFDLTFLDKLRAFHKDLEKEVPHLDDVTSLINVDYIHAQKDDLLVEELMAQWPKNQQDLERLKKIVLSKHAYRNNLISEDGKFTTVLIQSDAFSAQADLSLEIAENSNPFEIDTSVNTSATAKQRPLSDQENRAFVEAVQKVIDRYQSDDFPVYLSGLPYFTYYFRKITSEDMPPIIGLGFLVIMFMLLILFRRVSGIFIPMTVVVFSLISTMGIMALMDSPMTMASQVLPVFTLAVGVGDSVHLLVIFFQQYNNNGNKKISIGYAFEHSGLPVLLTSLTTAAGLLSFSGAEIAPIGSFGIFATVAVMLALLFSIILIPALISIAPLKPRSYPHQDGNGSWLNKRLTNLGNLIADHPGKFIFISLLIVAIGGYGISRLSFSHDPIRWLPKDNAFRIASELVDEKLKGSMTMEVVVDAGMADGLHEPEMMKKLDRVNRMAESLSEGKIYIGKSSSIVDTLKEIHQVLNEDNPDFYRVPSDRKQIAQELILFELSGPESLEKIVDTEFRQARITLKFPWVDSNACVDMLNQLNHNLKDIFQKDVNILTTGAVTLISRMMESLMHTMMKSYLIAGLVIPVMMILLIGSLKIGLLSMIPNILPIFLTMGMMGFMGIAIDASNILLGAIALGLAVDDTMHFMHNYRRYFRESGDSRQAILKTFHTSGNAMVFTTLILCFGFSANLVSSISSISNFGIITAFSLFLALVADFTLTPAIMVMLNRK